MPPAALLDLALEGPVVEIRPIASPAHAFTAPSTESGNKADHWIDTAEICYIQRCTCSHGSNRIQTMKYIVIPQVPIRKQNSCVQ